MKVKPIRNFLFHRVNPVRDALWDPMDVRLFERCVRHISRHYRVGLFEDLVANDRLKSHQRQATIMFDDGYKDNIEYAAPILEKYNCPASFYVVTQCIDQNIPTWTYCLDYAFANTVMKEIDLDFDFLPLQLRTNHIESKADRMRCVRNLKPLLKNLGHQNRSLVLKRVHETFSDVHQPKIMMDWNDLMALKSAGHYIGSHTVTHPLLGTIESEEDVVHELHQSALRIEQKLGHRPASISYPVGSFSPRVKELSRQAGYEMGLAVKQDVFWPENEDLFEVSRIELHNEPWWKTRLRISNTLETIKKKIHYR